PQGGGLLAPPSSPSPLMGEGRGGGGQQMRYRGACTPHPNPYGADTSQKADSDQWLDRSGWSILFDRSQARGSRLLPRISRDLEGEQAREKCQPDSPNPPPQGGRGLRPSAAHQYSPAPLTGAGRGGGGAVPRRRP